MQGPGLPPPGYALLPCSVTRLDRDSPEASPRVKRKGWLLGTHEAVPGGFVTVEAGPAADGTYEVHVVLYGAKAETLRDVKVEGERSTQSVFLTVRVTKDLRRLTYLAPGRAGASLVCYVNEDNKARSYPALRGGVIGLILSPNGRRLAQTGASGILLIDLDTGELLHRLTLRIGRMPASSVSFDASGEHLLFLTRPQPGHQRRNAKPVPRGPLVFCRLNVAEGKVVGKRPLDAAADVGLYQPGVLTFTDTGKVRLKPSAG
jgi:hypothetical protein